MLLAEGALCSAATGSNASGKSAGTLLFAIYPVQLAHRWQRFLAWHLDEQTNHWFEPYFTDTSILSRIARMKL